MERQLTAIQQFLNAEHLDGWLLYDFQGINPIARAVLRLSGMQTRRWFYWIPASGEPHKIVHAIEREQFAAVAGVEHVFSSWRELESNLKTALGGAKIIAMEYSPEAAIPYVSRIDAGTLELVRKTGVEVVSSADLVQYFQTRWTPEQLAGHRVAAKALADIKDLAFAEITRCLRDDRPVSEYDIQQLVVREFDRRKLATEYLPNCSVNENAANPHYEPTEAVNRIIKRGDLILLDIWAKPYAPDGVFADITWMAFAGHTAPERMTKVFGVVAAARDRAVEFISDRLKAGKEVFGYEVDDASRKVVADAGYGKYFTHRTGHSIGGSVHGMGVNIDNLETRDRRKLIPGVAFSIEPGIYLSGDFGVRTEINVYMHEHSAEVTTQPVQREIVPLDV